MFKDINACAALTEISADMLQDLVLGAVYLLIDTPDGYVANMAKLLRSVAHWPSASSRVKWIIFARN